MEGLDKIPWGELNHAYGSAGDVPELLIALETASPDLEGEDHPIWELFGNIYHQGTIYEATAFAVPFLIGLLESSAPDKVSILQLLAAIAEGGSYVEAHSEMIEVDQARLNQEKEWVKKAHDAIAEGFETYLKLSEAESDIRYQAVNLLASIPSKSGPASEVILDLISVEKSSLSKAGLLIELARTGKSSPEIVQLFLETRNASDVNLRTAGAIGLSEQETRLVPQIGWDLIKETVLTIDFIDPFYELPWDLDIQSVSEPTALYQSLPKVDQAEVLDVLVARFEDGESNDRFMWVLIPILFPDNKKLGKNEMTSHQLRVTSEMAKSILKRKMTFSGALGCFGLPDSSDLESWRKLK